ncbi:MAG: 4Fe-4S dicluster domain-containing protein [Bacteroidales bacterium]|nr:4Fe-4S dicluster domain-containing protein [Bacteroidales bacterium]
MIVFAGLLYFFLFTSAHLSALWQGIIKLQVVPAILGITSGGLLTVVLVLLLTLIFGRIYCSLICPLGIWQDIVNRAGLFLRGRKKRRNRFSKAHNAPRYLILIAVVICVAFSFILPLVWLDPYALFGKMAVNLGRPLVSLIAGSEYAAWSLAAFIISAVLFTTITVIAFFRGRLYCNTICPAGTLMGLISKISMFRIQIDTAACTHCQLCGTSCKARCIDCNSAQVDHSRCVVCMNCISACRRGGIFYRFSWKKKNGKQLTDPMHQQPKQQRNSRRAFLLAAMGAGIGTGAVLLNRFTEKKRVRITSSMPPGAGTLQRLKDKCIACQACIAACPSHIIKPAMGDFGFEGFLLPSVSYENGFCGYDCQKCQEVCPSGALKLMPLEEKKRMRIGVVKLTLENCIVEKFGTDCGACDEHCPVKAVEMTPREGTNKVFPKTNPAICIGCGGCEFICPATPKAIAVIPLSEQRQADAPVLDAKIKVEIDGFGF